MTICRQRRPKVRLEMSPLIDCIFLLLIFFMLSSTFLTPTIPLSLPRIQANDAVVNHHPIVITIDVDGNTSVNREPLQGAELQVRIGELLLPQREKSVAIRQDKDAKHRYFLEAMEAAKAAGAVQVLIAVEPKN